MNYDVKMMSLQGTETFSQKYLFVIEIFEI